MSKLAITFSFSTGGGGGVLTAATLFPDEPLIWPAIIVGTTVLSLTPIAISAVLKSKKNGRSPIPQESSMEPIPLYQQVKSNYVQVKWIEAFRESIKSVVLQSDLSRYMQTLSEAELDKSLLAIEIYSVPSQEIIRQEDGQDEFGRNIKFFMVKDDSIESIIHVGREIIPLLPLDSQMPGLTDEKAENQQAFCFDFLRSVIKNESFKGHLGSRRYQKVLGALSRNYSDPIRKKAAEFRNALQYRDSESITDNHAARSAIDKWINEWLHDKRDTIFGSDAA